MKTALLRCAIEQMASEDIFASLDEDSEPAVSIQFLELRGDKCYDLLANSLGIVAEWLIA